MQQAFDDYYAVVDNINRNGVVNSHGYDECGCAIGGHYTWHSLGVLNQARRDLSEATGIDEDWLRTAGF